MVINFKGGITGNLPKDSLADSLLLLGISQVQNVHSKQWTAKIYLCEYIMNIHAKY